MDKGKQDLAKREQEKKPDSVKKYKPRRFESILKGRVLNLYFKEKKDKK